MKVHSESRPIKKGMPLGGATVGLAGRITTCTWGNMGTLVQRVEENGFHIPTYSHIIIISV